MQNSPIYPCVAITGASAGLGEGYARALAARSSHLVLVARRAQRMHELSDELKLAHQNLSVTVIAADLSQKSERIEVAEQIRSAGLHPDLWINNAGLGDYGEFESAEWNRIESMLRVNIEALTHLTHLLLPSLQSGASIMNVSSLASLLPIPDFAVYAASKAYVSSFSEALRIELLDRRIHVLAVCPGPVRTEFGTVARRSEMADGIPTQPLFYIDRDRVVSDSIRALDARKDQVFTRKKIKADAGIISSFPKIILRKLMGKRPRRA
ncbi:MAG: SDR family NAD(P)-dependent oxidoreductase [Luteolibacter sp.]